MVVIRLARTGAKKNPFYHIVAADRRFPRDGRYIERLGYFNPMARGQDKTVEVQLERVEHWLNNGAQPSERVANILKAMKKGDVNVAHPTKTEIRQQQAAESAELAKKKLEEEKKQAEAAAKAEAEEAKKAAAEAKADEAAATEAAAEEAKPADDKPAE